MSLRLWTPSCPFTRTCWVSFPQIAALMPCWLPMCSGRFRGWSRAGDTKVLGHQDFVGCGIACESVFSSTPVRVKAIPNQMKYMPRKTTDIYSCLSSSQLFNIISICLFIFIYLFISPHPCSSKVGIVITHGAFVFVSCGLWNIPRFEIDLRGYTFPPTGAHTHSHTHTKQARGMV